MAAIQIVAEQMRGSAQVERDINAGPARSFRLKMTSPTFPTDASLQFQLDVLQRFHAGEEFVNWFGFGLTNGGAAGTVGKDGAVSDGLPVVGASFDGRARRIRVVATVPTAFVWGLTIEEI